MDFTTASIHPLPFSKDMGLHTGLTANGDTTPIPTPDPKPPIPGEQTYRQGVAQAGVGLAQLPGFVQPLPGTYIVYRHMSGHPTLALVKSIVTAPILACAWSFEVRRDDNRPVRPGPRIGDAVLSDPQDRRLAERCRIVRRMLEPLRFDFLIEALRALEFGWRPFEKIWAIRDRSFILQRLKPLLPDFTWIQVDDHGAYAGLIQMDAQLGPEKSFIYTYDGEAGNLYGRSRHENVRHVWHNWLQLDQRGGQLATKVAAIIPMVHYPMGVSRDSSGNSQDNSALARQILDGLSTAKGVSLPNLFADADDPRLRADLAGKSSWVISFLEAASSAANMTGLTEKQRYYDALMFRGWLRPERTGLETRRGGGSLGRSDSKQHTDNAIADSELIHGHICQCISRDIIDQILLLNEGESSRGSVYLTPAPLQDAKRDLLAKFLAAAWSDPPTLNHFISQTDMDSVFDLMEIPKSAETVTM